jgi:hypothetical protein
MEEQYVIAIRVERKNLDTNKIEIVKNYYRDGGSGIKERTENIDRAVKFGNQTAARIQSEIIERKFNTETEVIQYYGN